MSVGIGTWVATGTAVRVASILVLAVASKSGVASGAGAALLLEAQAISATGRAIRTKAMDRRYPTRCIEKLFL